MTIGSILMLASLPVLIAAMTMFSASIDKAAVLKYAFVSSGLVLVVFGLVMSDKSKKVDDPEYYRYLNPVDQVDLGDRVIKGGGVMMLGAIALGVSSRRRSAGPDAVPAGPGTEPALASSPARD